MEKHYAERDHIKQGKYYMAHVSAMTGEALHSKSAIAAELAHRDIEIERLRTLARDAYAAWDGDKDARVGKLLHAMLDEEFSKSYRPDLVPNAALTGAANKPTGNGAA